jgi:hypothetical protein
MSDPYREEIVLLRAQVNYLLERFADVEGLTARPVNWESLDADAAEEAWAMLAGWVDWLVDRYRLAETVPACWYTHHPVREELSALQVAWLGAYCDPAARASDGVAWHDMLERVLQRIRDHDLSGCANAGVHRNDVEPVRDPSSLCLRADAIRADIAARPRPPNGRDVSTSKSD